ncbi:MAG: GIY-YIG nuclease family protein [Planctomycetes bacterium]|nr:GIY-YIG nuclease family protein [Planctomycetota bacterium]
MANSNDAGAYQLVIEVRRTACVRIGRLGRFRFEPGRYVYCGSARRNLSARLARHRRKRKPLRWHIDYLRAHPSVRVLGTKTFALGTATECSLARKALARPGARIPAPGFGASDCREGCPSHLVRLR